MLTVLFGPNLKNVMIIVVSDISSVNNCDHKVRAAVE